jgi:hypothetical protein
MVFAKSLLQAGELACADRDEYVFARGLLLLHDAAESGLGAVADHLGLTLTPRTFLLNYYELIAASTGASIPYYTQMRNLNTIRVDIKHHGVFPDRKSNEHLPSAVRGLLTEVCPQFLNAELASFTLSSLIRDPTVRVQIETAEREYAAGSYEDCLVSLGYAMFHIAEGETVPWFAHWLKPEAERPRLEFTDFSTTNYSIKLIQYGVDPTTYYRFRNLTPRMGIDRQQNGKVVYYWDTDYGHAANWTQKNARFCLDFCIDTALRVQRLPEYDFDLVHFDSVYEHVIEPRGDSATIWTEPRGNPRDVRLRSVFAPPGPPEQRTAARVLQKGEKLVGTVRHVPGDPLDEWFLAAGPLFGYVARQEVTVTTRLRTAEAEAPPVNGAELAAGGGEPD